MICACCSRDAAEPRSPRPVLCIARSSGVEPLLFFRIASAPLTRSARTAGAQRVRTARCNGATPLLSQDRNFNRGRGRIRRDRRSATPGGKNSAAKPSTKANSSPASFQTSKSEHHSAAARSTAVSTREVIRSASLTLGRRTMDPNRVNARARRSATFSSRPIFGHAMSATRYMRSKSRGHSLAHRSQLGPLPA